jgi:predicted nucleic acid-binding protein
MGRQIAVERIRPWLEAREAATSALTYGEVIEMLKGRSEYPKRRNALRRLLREVHPYALTYGILERYGDIRRLLRPPHGPGLIGDIDTLIAATAIERDLTLVSSDGDFLRVPGLHTLIIERSELGRGRV